MKQLIPRDAADLCVLLVALMLLGESLFAEWNAVRHFSLLGTAHLVLLMAIYGRLTEQSRRS